ncbi:putative flippase GtrA [Labrenzia sp. EL_159]|uniref:GtrA family protein n=1 Tax=Roseibium album TaxID=311410 RepID=UPI0018C999D6|nr:putative flippase GtrA [Labrenzia sp. EL_162]MBG6193370.1 putative flippase GtrA [Labrenzia sp. EL_159]
MKQLLRYASVGLAANLIAYFVYLTLTYFSVEPKIAMTAIYISGLTASYLGNSRWTFTQSRSTLSTMIGYGCAHACGYAINFSLLYIFVDLYGFPHQIVQAVAIVIVACFLFVVFKTLVFSELRNGSSSRLP